MEIGQITAIIQELELEGKAHINDDFSIDVDGDVNIGKSITIKKARRLLVTFGKVTGNFNCNYSMLGSLIGSPRKCQDFSCSGNKLLNLKGAPIEVNNFSCTNNKGLILQGIPKQINGNCEIINCDLASLKGMEDTTVEGKADFSCNNIKGLDGMGNIKGKAIFADNNIAHVDEKILESGKVDVSDNPCSQDNVETSHFW